MRYKLKHWLWKQRQQRLRGWHGAVAIAPAVALLVLLVRSWGGRQLA